MAKKKYTARNVSGPSELVPLRVVCKTQLHLINVPASLFLKGPFGELNVFVIAVECLFFRVVLYSQENWISSLITNYNICYNLQTNPDTSLSPKNQKLMLIFALGVVHSVGLGKCTKNCISLPSGYSVLCLFSSPLPTIAANL